MTYKHFIARTQELLEQEAVEPERWWWLSWSLPVEKGGFQGAAIVRGRGIISALLEAGRKRCAAGGELVAIPMESFDPAGYENRLLSRQEVEELVNLLVPRRDREIGNRGL
jgi:hypothetical protein